MKLPLNVPASRAAQRRPSGARPMQPTKLFAPSEERRRDSESDKIRRTDGDAARGAPSTHTIHVRTTHDQP